MTANPFQKATRQGVHLRVLLIGKSGSGKSYTALSLACHTARALGTKVAVVDTEDHSARKYADEACACAQCRGHGIRFDFDDACLTQCSPKNYMDAMTAASANGYGVLVLDSISHEWDGPGGCLAMVDASSNKNKHAAWGPVTQAHNDFLAAIRSWPGHVFCTVRAKEKHEKQGRDVVSLGVLPVQRDGIEYEFDLAMFLDGARGNVVKSRASALAGWLGDRPGAELSAAMLSWAGEAPERPAEPIRDQEQPRQRPDRDVKPQNARPPEPERSVKQRLDSVWLLSAALPVEVRHGLVAETLNTATTLADAEAAESLVQGLLAEQEAAEREQPAAQDDPDQAEPDDLAPDDLPAPPAKGRGSAWAERSAALEGELDMPEGM